MTETLPDLVIKFLVLGGILLVAGFVAFFVSLIANKSFETSAAEINQDKFKLINCLEISADNTDNLVLDYNKFTSENLGNCIKSGSKLFIYDLDGKEILSVIGSNELSRRFPLCSARNSPYNCFSSQEFFVIKKENTFDNYLVKFEMVAKNE
ncbi:MAG: hypothetical protein HYS32_01595 [Candidatus Woesearchaeota archaeon]|nr:MAG: hypothetical protein HYS32_01595 [Candidatus Woesearchaeota archaeon]